MEENNQIIIYQTADNKTQIDVRMENDTVWLSTAQMAILFEREESNIRRHVINVFKDGELDKDHNVHFLHVNGVKNNKQYSSHQVPFYNTGAARYVPTHSWYNASAASITGMPEIPTNHSSW